MALRTFRQCRLRSGFIALALLGIAACTTSPEPASIPAPQSAMQMIQAAARALGPERARKAALMLQAEQSGTYHALEQARSPAQPVAEAGRRFRWSFDPSGQRLIRDAEQVFPGGIRFLNRSVVTTGGGWTVDLLKWRSGTDLATFAADEALRSRLQFERFFPHMLLEQAMGAGSAEAAGPLGFRYRDAAGALIEVALDPATKRPLRAALLVDGKTQVELAYLDYTRRHGVLMPSRLQLFQTGRLQEDLKLGATRIAAIEEARLTPPPGYQPPPQSAQPGAREIAPGVLFFENLPGNYHSLALDMGDHFVLVEAPLSPEYANLQKGILATLKPGKPVRFVLVTHHHGDHTGGLLAWAQAGATIIVPSGAKVAIERQLEARGFTGTARIEEVESRRSFGTGAARTDAYAFSTAHSEAHLIVHVPQSGILFQGDLFYLPERGDVPPAFPVVGDLQRQIDRLGLRVEQVVGVHGRPATLEQVRESLRSRELRPET